MFKALIGSVGLLALAAGTGITPATAHSAEAPPNALPPGMTTSGKADSGGWVALTDHRYENTQAARIRVMDPRVANWNTAAAQKWAWAPNGNVAVAATGGGGFIRVYTASQGSASAKYVNFPLNFAHGVSWDRP